MMKLDTVGMERWTVEIKRWTVEMERWAGVMEIKKCVFHIRHPLSSPDINILHQKLAIFVITGTKGESCALINDL